MVSGPDLVRLGHGPEADAHDPLVLLRHAHVLRGQRRGEAARHRQHLVCAKEGLGLGDRFGLGTKLGSGKSADATECTQQASRLLPGPQTQSLLFPCCHKHLTRNPCPDPTPALPDMDYYEKQ